MTPFDFTRGWSGCLVGHLCAEAVLINRLRNGSSSNGRWRYCNGVERLCQWQHLHLNEEVRHAEVQQRFQSTRSINHWEERTAMPTQFASGIFTCKRQAIWSCNPPISQHSLVLHLLTQAATKLLFLILVIFHEKATYHLWTGLCAFVKAFLKRAGPVFSDPVQQRTQKFLFILTIWSEILSSSGRAQPEVVTNLTSQLRNGLQHG